MHWGALTFFALSAVLQDGASTPPSDPLGPAAGEAGTRHRAEPDPARIQWFGTLAQGLAEAERTGRPILLSAATLRCDGVPGQW